MTGMRGVVALRVLSVKAGSVHDRACLDPGPERAALVRAEGPPPVERLCPVHPRPAGRAGTGGYILGIDHIAFAARKPSIADQSSR